MQADSGADRHCPYCDQRLLADEVVCWHCGRPLATAAQEAPDTQGAPAKQGDTAKQGAPDRAGQGQQQAKQRYSPAGVYGALTALVIAGALAFTIFLGRQPRLQATEVALPEAWNIVADRDETFTVYLPEAWQTLDVGVEDEAQQLRDRLAQDEAYRAATLPLGGFVEDDEALFLATGSEDSVFFLVMSSVVLNRLSEQEAIGLAQQADTTVVAANRVQNPGGSHAALRVELPQIGASGLSCRQQFRPGSRFSLLVALCSERERLNPDAADTILASFQRLRP